MINGNFGTSVKVEKSTFNPNAVWLFVRNSETGVVKGVLNLDKSQAHELAQALETHFRENNE